MPHRRRRRQRDQLRGALRPTDCRPQRRALFRWPLVDGRCGHRYLDDALGHSHRRCRHGGCRDSARGAYDALDRHGLTIAAGCGPTVGIAGLTLGGGLGILGRGSGLTCDQLRRARVVLADGRVVECDERRDEDLFWALRGAGGGTLGVVASFDFATVPARPGTGFHLIWPHSAAAAVIEAWQVWAPDAPDELAAEPARQGRQAAKRTSRRWSTCSGPCWEPATSTTVDLLDDLVVRAGQDPRVGRSRARVPPERQAIPG